MGRVSFFPSQLNLKDKKVLIIGGGEIAKSKLEKILDFTDEVSVISKDISSSFLELTRERNIAIEKRAYQRGDIDSFDIVIVATDNQNLQREIFQESRNSRVLVNSVDSSDYCDFIFSSYIKQGDLTISISTNGSSPAMAKRVRRYIENIIPSNIGEFLQEMKTLREKLPKGKERMRLFKKMSDDFVKKFMSR